ncbi:hypothetical protein QC590_03835 [Pseudomonas putida]|uniref:hypothetical protein n=1 Tax=Pseudomonas putida TaxID=303 RepID=UPI0033535331
MSIHRSRARSALASAQSELATDVDHRLKYAALELRMAIESVTYDRALAYKNEFPPHEYETWQPKKVMSVLLEIDSTADSDSTISIGVEPSPGQKPEVMNLLGTEVVFNLKTIKKHYDALGSYLHAPSLRQTVYGAGLDYKKMRKRCEEIAGILERVLASPVFNSTFGVFSSFECCECKVRIRRRMPRDKNTLEVDCFDCLASYTLTRTSDGQVRMDPHQHKMHCANTSCLHITIVLRREIVSGNTWVCEKCRGRNEFRLGLVYHPLAQ